MTPEELLQAAQLASMERELEEQLRLKVLLTNLSCCKVLLTNLSCCKVLLTNVSCCDQQI